MASGTNKRASTLVQVLKRMQEGDLRHAEDSPLPPSIRARLDKTLSSLEAALARSQAAKAGAHEATQSQEAALGEANKAMAAARRSVYAMYTDKDRVVEDYGISVKASPRKRKDEAKTPSNGTPPKGAVA